jgi:hypothetical protein
MAGPAPQRLSGHSEKDFDDEFVRQPLGRITAVLQWSSHLRLQQVFHTVDGGIEVGSLDFQRSLHLSDGGNPGLQQS